jgi:hypothetical protein
VRGKPEGFYTKIAKDAKAGMILFAIFANFCKILCF